MLGILSGFVTFSIVQACLVGKLGYFINTGATNFFIIIVYCGWICAYICCSVSSRLYQQNELVDFFLTCVDFLSLGFANNIGSSFQYHLSTVSFILYLLNTCLSKFSCDICFLHPFSAFDQWNGFTFNFFFSHASFFFSFHSFHSSHANHSPKTLLNHASTYKRRRILSLFSLIHGEIIRCQD